MTSERLIGGEMELGSADFAVRHGNSAWPDFGRANVVRCDTGRSAMALALADWRKRRPAATRAWVPSYVCESVIDAVKAAELIVAPYDDRPGNRQPCALVPSQDDIVVVIYYFGIPNAAMKALLVPEAMRSFGVIEDCVQAPYTRGVGVIGDYAVASLRKWWPAPDGAVLTADHDLAVTLQPADEKFVSMRAASKLLRGEMRDEQRYLGWIDRSEKLLAPQPRECSWLSAALLESVAFDAACERRRANWRMLREGLAGLHGLAPLFDELPVGAVPLAFPVLVGDQRRDELRDNFRKLSIFCPVHWPALADWPAASRQLSRDILSLPIDQRYDATDLNRIVRAARDFFK